MNLIREIITRIDWIWWCVVEGMADPMITSYEIFRKYRRDPECIIRLSFDDYYGIVDKLVKYHPLAEPKTEVEQRLGCTVVDASHFIMGDVLLIFDSVDRKNWFILEYM